MRITRKSIHIVGLAAASLVMAAGVAQAQVTEADVGVNPTYEQTGSTLSDVTSTGGFFSARAFVTSSTDYSLGTLNYGGTGSPAPLVYVPSDVAWEFSDSNSSFSTLQARYPAGSYVFDLGGDSQPGIAIGIDYQGGAYSNVPYVTNFSALQGLNASESFVVDLDAYIPGSIANASFIFFSIDDALGNTVFSADGLSDDTTSITVPGGLLAPGHSYTFDLLYSNRITGLDYISGLPVTQFYDTHTDGSFFTAGAVPEPSTWAMLLMGFVGVGVVMRRRALPARARAA